jgi:hypothetical protein
MKYIFGLNGSQRDSLHFVSDDELIYQAGNNIVEYNIMEKQQEIPYHGQEKYLGISCMALTSNKK